MLPNAPSELGREYSFEAGESVLDEDELQFPDEAAQAGEKRPTVQIEEESGAVDEEAQDAEEASEPE